MTLAIADMKGRKLTKGAVISGVNWTIAPRVFEHWYDAVN